MNITRTRPFFWLANKAFALHTLLSLIVCFGLFLSDLPAAAGGIIILWFLTAVVWQEWKHS
jgi:hypothetical protein